LLKRVLAADVPAQGAFELSDTDLHLVNIALELRLVTDAQQTGFGPRSREQPPGTAGPVNVRSRISSLYSSARCA
jgi:hypothetical protein